MYIEQDDSNNNESWFDLSSASNTEIIIGVCIILICCVTPLIAACICFCGYRKYHHKRVNPKERNDMELHKTKEDELVREIEKAAQLPLNPMQPSKSGLSAQDSLQIPPGLNDNYSECIEGLGKNGLDMIDDQKEQEVLKLDKNMASNVSEISDGMYESQNMETTMTRNVSTKI